MQHRGVLVLGIDFHTGLVVGDEVDHRLQAVVLVDEQEVVLVQVELLVADSGPFGHQLDADAFLDHRGGGAEAHTHAVLVVIVAHTHQCAVLVDVSVEQGVEHELRVAAVVAHLTLIGHPLALLGECQPDGVDAGRVVVQRVEVHLSVDTRLCRGVQVDKQFLETDVLRAQQTGNGVVVADLHVQLHGGQQPLDGLLVDDLVLVLRHYRVDQGGALLQQGLVARVGVEFHDEVATLDAGQRGVAVGAHQHPDLLRMVGGLLVGNV